MQRTNVAPSPLNLFTTWLVLLRKRFLERKHEKMRAQLKFRRAMRDDIMQKVMLNSDWLIQLILTSDWSKRLLA